MPQDPQDLTRLPTPALLVELPRLERNLDRMRQRAVELGVMLRPHVKSAKSPDIARLTHNGATGPITVSTLREAEYFADHGFEDITYAVCIVPAKLDWAAQLVRRGVRLQLLTDNPGIVEALARRAADLETSFELLVELDCGDGRTGIRPDDVALTLTAQAIQAAERLNFGGVLTHAGHAYDASDVEQIRAIAEQERSSAVQASTTLAELGLACPTISVGSTPTIVHAEHLRGVTEIRPGICTFFDLHQCALHSCKREDIALSVLATVIAHTPQRGHIVLDAGALALSKDGDRHYGELCDPLTLEPLPQLFVRGLNQEHGLVPINDPADYERLPVGRVVRILPNHGCLTAAPYQELHVIEAGRRVATWPRLTGW